MHMDEGLSQNPLWIIFKRYLRLTPLYLLTLLLFWKFLPLFGGDGPLFWKFDESNGCAENWIWHITYLNNLIPWNKKDLCMPWTWYLANDF